MLVETNVAEILVTMASTQSPVKAEVKPAIKSFKGVGKGASGGVLGDAADLVYGAASSHELCERIKMQVSRELSDDEELDIDLDSALMRKDKSDCTPSDLDRIRRERNRMHAKKTRLRKKKMLLELEQLVDYLEGEVVQLHGQVMAHRGFMNEDIGFSSGVVAEYTNQSDDTVVSEEGVGSSSSSSSSSSSASSSLSALLPGTASGSDDNDTYGDTSTRRPYEADEASSNNSGQGSGSDDMDTIPSRLVVSPVPPGPT